MAIGTFFWKRGDGTVIDGGLNGLAMGIIPFFTRLAGRAQSGYIFTYAFWMVIGIGSPADLDVAGRRSKLMESLLSIVTFFPLIAAAILALFLRGEDEGRTAQTQNGLL